MSTKIDEHCLAVHDRLLALQRKRRLIAVSRGSPVDNASKSLGYVEEGILHLCSRGDGRGIGDLAEAMHLERSWVSRIVAALGDRKLVEVIPDKNDRRSKIVSVTPLGVEAMENSNEVARDILSETLCDLNKSEKASFAKYLQLLCDGFDAPAAPALDDADPIDLQLARLSRVTGAFGSDLLGSGLNLTQVHILHILAERRDTVVSVRDLDAILPFDTSTTSRVVAGFEAEGLLSKRQSEHDKRSVAIKLTRKGFDRLDTYRKRVVELFSAPITRMAKGSVVELLSLFDKALLTMPRSLTTRSADAIRLRSTNAATRARHSMRSYGSDATVHFFAVERGSEMLAELCVVRNRESNHSLEVTISGDFPSRSEVSDILRAVADQFE